MPEIVMSLSVSIETERNEKYCNTDKCNFYQVSEEIGSWCTLFSAELSGEEKDAFNPDIDDIMQAYTEVRRCSMCIDAQEEASIRV